MSGQNENANSEIRFYSPDDNLEEKKPREELEKLSKKISIPVESEEFSAFLDSVDHLAYLREEFRFPKINCKEQDDSEEKPVYFCGNSLGLQPKKSLPALAELIDDLSGRNGIKGFHETKPGVNEDILIMMANIVGAKPREISLMNALTVNLHLLLASFYRPTPKRHKILIESKAFPSDHYLVESQIHYHGLSPKTSMVAMEPRADEEILRLEDILDFIEREGDSLSLVLLPGVQYYTGQLFDMKTITKAAQAKGCYVGFDLAHAVGNVDLHLHDWGVDFGAWCTYKYLNSGPGSIGGAFIHENHSEKNLPKFLGAESWEHNEGEISSIVKSYAVPPPCPLLLSNLKCSLEIFSKTSVKELRNKSFYLTGLLEYLLEYHFNRRGVDRPLVSTITPKEFKDRGAHLSLVFRMPVEEIHEKITKGGIVCDLRKPNVIRIAPAPIYCSFQDVFKFVKILKESLEHWTPLKD